MSPFKGIKNDKIEIIKPDGRTFHCDNSSVQSEKVFIYCGEIPLEEGDTIIYKIDENRKQEFIVIERGYYNNFLGEHYQAKVKRKVKTTKITSTSPKTTENIEDKHHYDVFISYSYEDKELVNELYEKLKEKGLKIWYDNSELSIGDNLRENINIGLTNCKFGVVILSETFINKSWPKREYDSLYPLMDEDRLLPIIHGLNREQLEKFDKALTNIIYRDTKDYSIHEIADEIYAKIKKSVNT